jgi:hypothetical protein
MRSGWCPIPAVPVAAVVIAVLAAAGCGGSGSPGTAARPSAAALAKELKASLRGAGSVHIQGTIAQNGETGTLNLSLTRSGGAAGTVALNADSFAVLSTGGTSYLKITPGFLRYAKLPASRCASFCGKYIEAPAGESQSIIGAFSMKSFLGSMASTLPSVSYAGTATVNGTPAWKLQVADGSTAFVAASGTHYLLRVLPPHGQTGRIDFTRWNSVTIPAPPPASQVVSATQLFTG